MDGELDVDLLAIGPRGEPGIQTYRTRWGVLQFHLAVPGVPGFEAAEQSSVWLANEDGERVRCLSARDLLASKRAANRAQDLQDIACPEEFLRVLE